MFCLSSHIIEQMVFFFFWVLFPSISQRLITNIFLNSQPLCDVQVHKFIYLSDNIIERESDFSICIHYLLKFTPNRERDQVVQERVR